MTESKNTMKDGRPTWPLLGALFGWPLLALYCAQTGPTWLAAVFAFSAGLSGIMAGGRLMYKAVAEGRTKIDVMPKPVKSAESSSRGIR